MKNMTASTDNSVEASIHQAIKELLDQDKILPQFDVDERIRGCSSFVGDF